MDADDLLREQRRLRDSFRELHGPPTERQHLLALMLDPAAWTPSAQEHVDWAARHGRMHPSLSFGGQYACRRTIAMARAAEMLDALDRLADGRPQVERHDHRSFCDALQKEHPYDREGRTARSKAIGNMRMLRCLDGHPAPRVAELAEGYELRWTLRQGEAVIEVDAGYDVRGRLEPARPDHETWSSSIFSDRTPALVGDLLRPRPDAPPPARISEDTATRPDGAPALLGWEDVRHALAGAATLYEHESDNDTEAMFITAAGQYVRRTGEAADRYVVLDREDAREIASGYMDQEDMDLLMP